jgi:MFS family permease
VRAFRAILSRPGALAMTSAAFVGRFPMAMLGLALTLLVVTETGSYASAGAVAASVTLAAAVGGPLGARLADRYGQHRVLPPLILVHVTAVGLLTLAVLAGAPQTAWLALGAVAGLAGPNVGAMVRSRWAQAAQGPRELTSAFALESTLDEVAFVLGPPLATVLAVSIAPWSAIAAGMLLAASGTLALAAQRATEPAPTARTEVSGTSPWRSATLRTLTVLMVLMGAVFGALEVGTVAFAQERGVVATTGLLLGLFALSSGLTGLYLGARPGGWPLTGQLLVGTLAVTLATAALPLIPTVGWFGLGMFASGFGVSAVLIGSMQMIERALPRARLTESLAVAISGIQVGFAAAAALSGHLIDLGGSAWGLAVGSGAAVTGLLLVVAARGQLARATATDLPAGPTPVAAGAGDHPLSPGPDAEAPEH